MSQCSKFRHFGVAGECLFWILGGAVPRGHFAVYVGEARARFVIPTAYLRHPSFVALLESAEEEFGFDHHGGGIIIPCSESDFVELVGSLSSSSPSSSWRH